jgi:lipopolysaccharide export system ATP-binding protein
LLFILIFIIFFISKKYFFNEKKIEISKNTTSINLEQNNLLNQNTVERDKNNEIIDLVYEKFDTYGNKYLIMSKKGVLDKDQPDIIYMNTVEASLTYLNNEKLIINSKEAIFNKNNFKTTFSKNVKLAYQDQILKSDNLEFLIDKNIAIFNDNVKYYNQDIQAFADIVVINLLTKEIEVKSKNQKKNYNKKKLMAIVKKFRIISHKQEKNYISLENISVSFKKSHQILDNVSLNIPKGQILGLLGPNGAGKSTLMNVISGLIKPNYGKVKINNKDISDLPIYVRTKKFKISIIPQFGGLFASLTTEENIRAVAEILIKDKSFIDIKINELIAKFELDSVKKIEAKYLSGGQKRRLVIAMGLISKPDIILMDEPLAALDPQTIQMLQNTIVKLQTDLNLTIIITDHQARDLLAICDKAIILSNSKIVASGSPNDLIKDESANKFYFGDNFQFN